MDAVSAFPYDFRGKGGSADEGMTLRDYFAGQAITGILADPSVRMDSDERLQKLAELAYIQADAMLKARK